MDITGLLSPPAKVDHQNAKVADGQLWPISREPSLCHRLLQPAPGQVLDTLIETAII